MHLTFTINTPIMNILLSIVVGILSFGASPDKSASQNALAINKAISSCAEKGGGTVVVPKGTFATGTVYMKSNITLQLDSGATLLGSTDISDYSSLTTSLDLSKYESGQGTVNYNSATDPQWSKAMIMAVECSDIAIEGQGTIDGNNVRNPLGEEHMRGPHTILMAGCKNVDVDGLHIRNSANYAILAYRIEKAAFRNLTIEGGWDGIHIRGSRSTTIERCQLHTGDDAIAGGYWEKMIIRRCTLNSSCNGLRMIMPSQNVDIADCHIYGPGRFEHITSHRTNSEAAVNLEPGGWGKAPGRMDNIRIRRCDISRVLTPICVTLGDDNTCGTIRIEDVKATHTTRMALSVKSWGKAPTDKVVMKRCKMQFCGIDDPDLPKWFEGKPTSQWPVFPCWGLFFRNVGKVVTKDVTIGIEGKDYRTPYMCQNVGEENLANGVIIE